MRRELSICLTMPHRTDSSPSLAEIEAIAIDIVNALPAAFRDHAKSVILRVEERASDEVLDGLGIEDPLELTGLYEGIPLTEKSVFDQAIQPDMVWLFRSAILDEWNAREDTDLASLVANVVVHEFAHHFGWSDDDIASIDQWWT